MRFTSLLVELLRARPRLVFWSVTLLLALLWLLLPAVFFSSPPGDVAEVLAFGREYVLGTDFGPPLAFWLADVAFRAAGQHMIGLYALSQLCTVVTFWTLFRLSQPIVGTPHAVLVIILSATVVPFGLPNLDFGPDVLAEPLWALVLLNGWRVIGQGKREGWFALSMNAGLLLLTAPIGFLLLALLIAFTLTSARGRRALMSLDPLFALIVVLVMLVPYLFFLIHSGFSLRSLAPVLPNWQEMLTRWPELVGVLLLTLAGIAVLTLANSGRLSSDPEQAPIIYRPPVDPFARRFVFFFAIAPLLCTSLITAILGRETLFGGGAVPLLLSGLAVILLAGDLIYLRRQQMLRILWSWIVAAPAVFVLGTVFVQPWIGGTEVKTMIPAAEIGAFFGDNFQRRTGQRLAAVAGDPQLAGLIAYAAPARPHLFLDASPQRTPWITMTGFNASGGLVVWRAADTAGTPPEDIARRFPGLAPEVPRSFQRYLNGRQPPLRIGWGIVRPKAAASQ